MLLLRIRLRHADNTVQFLSCGPASRSTRVPFVRS